MKRYLLFFFLVLLFLTGIAAGLYWSSAQVPDFYQEALQEQMEPEVRQEEAKEFVQRSMQVVNKVRNHEPLWSQEFSEQQVNAWLAEELHQKYNKWVPDGVTDPRIRFEKNQVELGFHLTLSQWSGIISLKFKPWLFIEWGQSNGNDAIIVYLDRRKPELPELTALAVETGLFRIAGKSESDTQ